MFGAQVQSRKLGALTSLRFVAAALVVISHSGWFALRPDLMTSIAYDNAVAFFFVLSGFILTYTYEVKVAIIGARRFWLLRLARLWPAHLLALLLVVLVLPPEQWAPAGGAWPIALSNVLLVHAWIPLPQVYYSFNVVSWSISTEFAFYLLFPALVRNWRSTWTWKLGGAALLTVSIIAICNALGLAVGYDDPGVTAVGLLYPNPLARLFEFTLGMALALAFPWTDRRLKRMGVAAVTCIEVVCVSALAVDLASGRALLAGSADVALIGPAGFTWLTYEGLALPAIAPVVLICASGVGWIGRILSHPIGVLLGEISYSVYLLHTVLFRLYGVRLQADPLPPALSYAIAWAVLLVLSYASWRFIEAPIRRLARRRWDVQPRNVSALAWPDREIDLAGRRLAVHLAVPQVKESDT